MQRFKCFNFIHPSAVRCLLTPNAQARVGPKLVVFLHQSADSGRLSSDSLLPEFRSLALLIVHAVNFINDCAFVSIVFFSF